MKTRYYYHHRPPTVSGPFLTVVRHTRGTFTHVTPPCGTFGSCYAVFQNRASEVWVPVHDLTKETKARLRL